jgi:hypothetical protein
MGYHNNLSSVNLYRLTDKVTIFFIDFGLANCIINSGGSFLAILRKGGYSFAQTTGIYIDRAAGGNRNYCAFDGDIDAGPAAC